MSKLAFAICATVFGGSAIACITAARYQPTIRPNTFVGPVLVGGLTPIEAGRRLRLWWETEKVRPLNLRIDELNVDLPPQTPGKLGVALDDEATVQRLPVVDLVDGLEAGLVSKDYTRGDFEPSYRLVPADLDSLEKAVAHAAGPPKPARVAYKDGDIVRTPETYSFALDRALVSARVIDAVKGDGSVHIPIKHAVKKVPDDALAAVSDVVTSFTTRFPTSKRTRCANIKLAAGKINGTILMPGDRFSFNDIVGRRTIRAGFQIAGVYKNGKHDIDVGGGICQVSTTLYNAALIADLKIVQRHNHTFPVAYVPLGQDATVDYGTTDLVIENNMATPIALCDEYRPGKLTFRVLGKKDPALKVRIIAGPRKSWAHPVRTVVDATLRNGRKRVVDIGGQGHSLSTFRLVFLSGKLVRREPLGRSYYPGGPRIVAVGRGGLLKARPVTPTASRPAPTGAIPRTIGGA